MRYLWLAVALAGCLSPAQPSPDVGAPPGPSPLAFEAPVLVGPQGDVETSLLVADDGAVLTCSHGGFHQPSPLWASVDGAAFRRIEVQPNPVVSGDCDLAVLDSGRWVIVYDTIASATIAWSDDRGASWGFQYAAALPIGVDRPWIAAAGDVLYMTYSDVMAALPAVQMFARSTDGGATWVEQTPLNVAEPPDKVQAIIGRMALSDGGRTIHVPLARANLHTGGPVFLDLAVSRDAGATWSIEPVHGPYDAGALVLPVATWAGGALHMTVVLPNGTGHDVGVLRQTGPGWTGPHIVARGVVLPGVAGPWVDGRPDGSVTLAWLEEVEAGWTVSAARLTADGAVLGPVQLAEPTDRDQGIGHEFIMLDHGPDGRAHVTWPMDTGPECDPAPNAAESRGSQCVYWAVEAPRPGARPQDAPG